MTLRQGTVTMNGLERVIDTVLVKSGSRKSVRSIPEVLASPISLPLSVVGSGSSKAMPPDGYHGRSITLSNTYVHVHSSLP